MNTGQQLVDTLNRIADMERQLNAAHAREAERYRQWAEQRQRAELAERENAKLREALKSIEQLWTRESEACADNSQVAWRMANIAGKASRI